MTTQASKALSGNFANIHVERVDGQCAYYADGRCSHGRTIGIGSNIGFTARQAYYKAWDTLNKECGVKHQWNFDR